MDTLCFKIEERPESLQKQVAIPFINGKSLIEIVKSVELNYDKSLAGSYDGIRPEFLKDELANGSFIDKSKSRILECECGVDGCWSLLIKVTQNDNSVKWTCFQQYHSEDWDYSGLEFEFEKKAYSDAVNNLV